MSLKGSGIKGNPPPKETSPLLRAVRSVRDWLRRGEAPPKSHRRSMRIMVALLFFGILALSLLVYNISHPEAFRGKESTYSFLVCAFLTLCPGVYALWITVCCWRKVPGYDWGMIPFFD